MAVEQGLLVGGGEVAIVGHTLVIIVGDEVEDVLLKVRTGADDGVDLVLTDHLGEGEAELGRGHGPGEGDEHLAAGLQVGLVTLGRVDQRGGIEMAIVVGEKLRDRAFFGGELGVDVLGEQGLPLGGFDFMGHGGRRKVKFRSEPTQAGKAIQKPRSAQNCHPRPSVFTPAGLLLPCAHSSL